MSTVIVAILLLVACVAAIYWLLKSMGQEGVEIAAPGSCKSGRCGVRNCSAQPSNESGEIAESEPQAERDSGEEAQTLPPR